MPLITKRCPFSGHETSVEVTEEQYVKIRKGVNIAVACADKNAFEREVLISGMCFACQESIFNTPAPGHEKDWGERLGHCDCCDAPIYSIRNKCKDKDDEYECKSCHCLYKHEQGKLIDITPEPEDYE